VERKLVTIDRDSTTEAYQILADLLVTIRRVIHRGLEKVSGKQWYLEGCPPGLFEKLVERKEKEKAVDRFGGEYQELITFASLDDLAAIIEHNGDLARLLTSFERNGAPMIDRLRDIEALRLKMAASVPFDEKDLDTISRYHREFRDSLTRRKRGGDEPPPSSPPPGEETAAEHERQDESGIEPADGEDGAEADESGVDLGTAEIPVDFGTQAVTFEELVDVVGGPETSPEIETPVTDDDRGQEAARSEDDVDDPADASSDGSPRVAVELAMADDDDVEVLRLLHTEVMGIAESAYQKVLDIGHPVWDTVRSSGWYDIKKADLALAPLELFYSVVARAAEVQRSGAGFEAVKACLEDAEFSKLLLSLREMFLRQKL
jgi:hypothetical protein